VDSLKLSQQVGNCSFRIEVLDRLVNRRRLTEKLGERFFFCG